MKKENSTLLKKLAQYSALAAPMLAIVSAANSQIIYTDIDPDAVLDTLGATLNLDLNNDGAVDYVFFTDGGANFTYAGVYPYLSTIAGNNQLLGSVSTGGQVPYGFPAALNYGDLIDANQPIFGLADIAFTIPSSSQGPYFYRPAMYSFLGGNPHGNWINGATDKYLGFRFTPDSVKWYFGWARCDVSDDAKTLTVKDYAYDSIPDQGLNAGETDNVGIPLTPGLQPLRIFGFEGVANVIVGDGKLEDAFVTVINTMGQTVVSQRLTDKITRIDLNKFGKGIYMVTIKRGEESFSKKVSFR